MRDMNRELAQDFAKKYREFGTWFDEMTSLTQRIDNPDEARRLRKALADMSFALDDVVLLPIRKDYPGLFEI